MAVDIEALGDTIKISQSFITGKDRVFVNGDEAFVGRFNDGEPQTFHVGSREYMVSMWKPSSIADDRSIRLRIYENNVEVHSGIYDPHGKQVESYAQAEAGIRTQVSAVVGALIGGIVVNAVGRIAGILPNEIMGSVIAWAIGGILGFGIASLLFDKKVE